MLEHPGIAALAIGNSLAKDVLQLMAPVGRQDGRQDAPVAAAPPHPICLDDVGWLDHYGHRHHDVDVERL
jgi:hypothetical protein